MGRRHNHQSEPPPGSKRRFRCEGQEQERGCQPGSRGPLSTRRGHQRRCLCSKLNLEGLIFLLGLPRPTGSLARPSTSFMSIVFLLGALCGLAWFAQTVGALQQPANNKGLLSRVAHSNRWGARGGVRANDSKWRERPRLASSVLCCSQGAPSPRVCSEQWAPPPRSLCERSSSGRGGPLNRRAFHCCCCCCFAKLVLETWNHNECSSCKPESGPQSRQTEREKFALERRVHEVMSGTSLPLLARVSCPKQILNLAPNNEPAG